ncbi:MAG TPA: cation transporter [Tissierellaceae bacterium]|nr:cation transporter [Tissierellaceae bacterium]
MKKILTVEGMSCVNCENAVKKVLNELEEVTGVEVDLGKKLVEVEGNNLDDDKLKAVIDEAGYDLIKID